METKHLNEENVHIENDNQEEKSSGQRMGSRAAAAVGGAVGAAAGFAADEVFGRTTEEPVVPEKEPVEEQEKVEEPVVERNEPEKPEPEPVTPDPVNPDPVNPDPVNPNPVNPEPNPDDVDDIISGEFVDQNDIVDDTILKVEEVGTINMYGNDYNAAVVTIGPEGESYVMVDVDGDLADPNATYDFILDENLNPVSAMPQTVTVDDAVAMMEGEQNALDPNVFSNPNWANDAETQVAMNDIETDMIDPNDMRY
ncbi:MAG: hypothetical protein J6T88_05220 [Bacteroidales bacterium]|nr:hypothetical protein [Bacteroidales bacterium]